MKNYIITAVVIILVAVGIYFIVQSPSNDVNMPDDPMATSTEDPNGTSTDVDVPDADDSDQSMEGQSVIGQSAGGHDIDAYHFGDGDEELIFVGGIHGGYEWNTTLVAYELIDYLEEDESRVPSNLRVTVIPVLNPDGLNEVVGTTERFSAADVPSDQSATVPGRFNANDVDLNRNFDCDWQSTGQWQDRSVDAGDSVFSEPESQAFRDYVENNNPEGVVVYFSAADGVFASNCHNGVLDETRTMTNVYADGSGYPAYESYDFYEITGDVTNWLAKENIPAISVLLSNHTDTEWDMNREGVESLFDHFSN